LTYDPNFSGQFAVRGWSRPAARAGWLMAGIGVLLLLGAGLFIACAFIMPYAQLTPEQAAKFRELEKQLPVSMTAFFVAVGSAIGLAGIYHLILGFFVRRGKRGAIYTGIVTSVIAIGFCALYMLAGILMGGADAIGGMCFLVVIGTLFVWLITWLIQALRGGGAIGAAAQAQAQYWQMMQQQQGYVQVPPPPMGILTAPPPPPEPPSPEPTGWAYGAQTPPPAPPGA
jgi:MFS family permease